MHIRIDGHLRRVPGSRRKVRVRGHLRMHHHPRHHHRRHHRDYD